MAKAAPKSFRDYADKPAKSSSSKAKMRGKGDPGGAGAGFNSSYPGPVEQAKAAAKAAAKGDKGYGGPVAPYGAYKTASGALSSNPTDGKPRTSAVITKGKK